MTCVSGAAAPPSAAAGLAIRARGEFIEMPGLRLTIRQAARLWALEATTAEAVLEELVAAGFLRRRRDGSYLRLSRADR